MKHDDEDLIRSRREQELIRARQRSRAIVTALLLGGLAVLFFLITLARIQQGMSR